MQTRRFVAFYAVVALVAMILVMVAPSVFGATTISTSISTGGNLTVSGSATLSGNTTLGDASTDTITVTGKLAGGSLFFVKEVDAEISVQDSSTAATAGALLSITGSMGATTGAGGGINITGGTGGTTGGNGGGINIIGGPATHSAASGGTVTIRGGAKGSAGTDGTITIGDSNTSTITIGYANGTTTLAGFTQSARGTVSLPSIAFTSDSNTGIYSTGADNLSVTVGGTQRFSASEGTQAVTITGTTTIAGSTTITTGPLTIPGGGSASNPTIIFSGDSDTGIYSVGANEFDISVGGTNRLSVANAGTGSGPEIGITGTSTISGNLRAGTGVSGGAGGGGSTTIDIAGSTTNSGVCHGSSGNSTNDVAIVDCDATPAADYAERYPVAKDTDYGDIVVPGTRIVYTDAVLLPNADGSGFNTFPSQSIVELVKSSVPYQEPIAGIVSDNWGDFSSAGNNINKKDIPKPIALVGRVPVKVTDEGGPISIGDFLTTSSTAGHAMKATKSGRVIGMALGSFTGKKGKVMVQVLNTWWTPSPAGETLKGDAQLTAATSQIQAPTNVSLEKVEKLTVQKNATIQGRLIVKGNARFDGQISVSKDTAGNLTVKAGQKTARFDFGTPYRKVPAVTVTPLGNPGGYFWISDVSEKGFTVNVSKAPTQDLAFNWIALGSNAGLGEEEAKAKAETAVAGTAQ